MACKALTSAGPALLRRRLVASWWRAEEATGLAGGAGLSLSI